MPRSWQSTYDRYRDICSGRPSIELRVAGRDRRVSNDGDKARLSALADIRRNLFERQQYGGLPTVLQTISGPAALEIRYTEQTSKPQLL